MKTQTHKADSRGHANHGWLNSYHSFSFANYYNPEKMNFGRLRVLNDDTVSAGHGFGRHPHRDMEIISIPLEGDLKHADSMGTEATIRQGEIQVMSAGTGVFHSEMNGNEDKEVKFLQIWIEPNDLSVEPRYDQQSIAELTTPNEFSQILSPNKEDSGVWIHQNAWMHFGEFDQDKEVSYELKDPSNGVYLFVIDGSGEVNGEELNKRDAIGVWDTNNFNISASKGSKILLMEVPMN